MLRMRALRDSVRLSWTRGGGGKKNEVEEMRMTSLIFIYT
jgi:hypothetical protein